MEINPISNSNDTNSTSFFPEYYTPKFWQNELGFLGTQIRQSDASWKQAQSDIQSANADPLN